MRKIVLALLMVFLLSATVCEAKVIENKYAKLFSIEKDNGYYIVKDSLNRTIVLWKDKKPSIKADLFVKIPVKRVVALSTTFVSYLEAIDCQDSIVGVVSTKKWYFEDIEEKIKNGEIISVGRARSPDYERILSLNPDIVLIHPRFAGNDVIKKFDSLGIPYVACDAAYEGHPLGRLEWVKPISTFFDKLDKAEDYFNSVEGKVIEIQKMVEGEEKTNVVYALVLKGRVKVPGIDSYHAKFVEMAGGNYMFKDLHGTGYVAVSVEELINRAANADVFIEIYMGSPIESKDELIQQVPGLAETKPFKEDRVYTMQPWFWQRIHKMDKIIEDLAAILHPELFPQHELTMFKKI